LHNHKTKFLHRIECIRMDGHMIHLHHTIYLPSQQQKVCDNYLQQSPPIHYWKHLFGFVSH